MNPLVIRVLLVVLLIALMALAVLVRRRRPTRTTLDGDTQLPIDLIGGGSANWIVFTTPYCVSCDTVADLLREDDPTASVQVADVSERPDLARDLGIRRAPTTLLADGEGRIRLKLVGLEAVREHLYSLAS